MTEQRNYRVYEVTIREQVILHTTFRVAVDAEGELDEEATLEGHINDSPAYLYSLDKDGNIFPNYYAEVEDIDDEEPVLTDVVELKENQKKRNSPKTPQLTANVTDDQGLSITLVNGVDVDLNLEDPRGDRDRIESYLDDNNIDYDDLSLDIDYEEQYLEEE